MLPEQSSIQASTKPVTLYTSMPDIGGAAPHSPCHHVARFTKPTAGGVRWERAGMAGAAGRDHAGVGWSGEVSTRNENYCTRPGGDRLPHAGPCGEIAGRHDRASNFSRVRSHLPQRAMPSRCISGDAWSSGILKSRHNQSGGMRYQMSPTPVSTEHGAPELLRR